MDFSQSSTDEVSDEKAELVSKSDSETSSQDRLPLIDIEERWTIVAVDAVCVLAACIPILSIFAVIYLFWQFSGLRPSRRRLLLGSPVGKEALLWFMVMEFTLWPVCFMKSLWEISTYLKIYARFHLRGDHQQVVETAEAVGADLLFTTCYVCVPLLYRVLRYHMRRVGSSVAEYKLEAEGGWQHDGNAGVRAQEILDGMQNKFEELFIEDSRDKDAGGYKGWRRFCSKVTVGLKLLVLFSTLIVFFGLAYLQYSLGHDMYYDLKQGPDLWESTGIFMSRVMGKHHVDLNQTVAQYESVLTDDERDRVYDFRWYSLFLLPGVVCVVQATFYWFLLAAAFVVATTRVKANTDRLLVFTALTKESKVEMWTKKNRDELMKIVSKHYETQLPSDASEAFKIFTAVWDVRPLDLQDADDVRAWWLLRKYMHIDFNDESACMDFCGIAVVVLLFCFAVAGFLVWVDNQINGKTFGLFLLIFLLSNFLIFIMNWAFTACIDQNLLLERDGRVLVDATLSTLMRPDSNPEEAKQRQQVALLHQAIQRKIESYDDKQRLFGVEVTANLRNSLLLYGVTTASASVWKLIANVREDL
ncbi:unnamed protein product [Symbiodinium natans]|uniref:Uncharacterized protein n=1 Tax=Symbiodinium natans TaxID=878477 RepID=A0A812P9G3_9DINO|nr:unnamed protein product [Symbiodinium natans]